MIWMLQSRTRFFLFMFALTLGGTILRVWADASQLPPTPEPTPIVATTEPRSGLVLPCEIVEWHDGDTGTVRITLDVRVRLLDCWAPEVTSRKLTEAEKKLPKAEQLVIANKLKAEKDRGLASTEHLRKLAPVGTRGKIEIPLEGMDRSDDVFTMGRVLGRVWIDGKDLSAEQVSACMATIEKETK